MTKELDTSCNEIISIDTKKYLDGLTLGRYICKFCGNGSKLHIYEIHGYDDFKALEIGIYCEEHTEPFSCGGCYPSDKPDDIS